MSSKRKMEEQLSLGMINTGWVKFLFGALEHNCFGLHMHSEQMKFLLHNGRNWSVRKGTTPHCFTHLLFGPAFLLSRVYSQLNYDL